MSKKVLRVTAIAVGLCLVLAIAPMLNSAEKKPVSSSIKILSLLKRPLYFVGSLLNLFPYPPVIDSGIIDEGKYASYTGATTSKVTPKTTEDIMPNTPTKKD